MSRLFNYRLVAAYDFTTDNCQTSIKALIQRHQVRALSFFN